METEDAEEFTRSLGQIVSGSWRQIALAKKIGVPKALGLSTEQWVNERLGGYVKLSITDRREAVQELTADGLSQRGIASILGIDHATVQRDLNGANAPQPPDQPLNIANTDEASGANAPLDAVAALAADEKVKTAAKATETRKAKEEQRKADLERPVDGDMAPGLYHGDFRELAGRIADDSVQLVFTDPPYDRASIDLFDDAAKVARRILKPGGSFITYTGNRHLLEVLTACSRHLDYWWTIAGVHGGGKQVMKKLGIRAGWKPLLWFVKGTRGDVGNILLDVVTGTREKTDHEWQQSEQEALYFIEKLSTHEGLVVDFFVGGGTTAAAANKLGRAFIGFEINAASAERASRRLTA